MDDARKRKFDAMVVWRFDRFARSTKHLLLALEEFRSLGIQFISYQENIDTSSPLGQALFTIVSAVAQLERDLIRERVTAGIRNARANGKQLGRPRRIVKPKTAFCSSERKGLVPDVSPRWRAHPTVRCVRGCNPARSASISGFVSFTRSNCGLRYPLANLASPKSRIFGVLTIGHKNVCRLDVAVDNSLGMGGIQGVGNLDSYRQQSVQIHWPTVDASFSVSPSRQRDVRLLVTLADIVNGADVGMVESGRGTGFTSETIQCLRILGHLIRQELERAISHVSVARCELKAPHRPQELGKKPLRKASGFRSFQEGQAVEFSVNIRPKQFQAENVQQI